MRLDDAGKSIEFKKDWSESLLILRDHVVSVCKVTDTCYLVGLQRSNDLLVLKNWTVVSRTAVSDPYILETHLKLPGFDLEHFPNIIVQSKYNWFT